MIRWQEKKKDSASLAGLSSFYNKIKKVEILTSNLFFYLMYITLDYFFTKTIRVLINELKF